MKEVTTVTIRQDPDEPRLKMRIYRSDSIFYIRIETDHLAVPLCMPIRVEANNFKDAKSESEKFLRIIRGLFRHALGKTPDLPEEMKEMESEIPAFLHSLLTHNSLGQN
jgi:hypothetical protein